MTPQEIHALLKKQFGDAIADWTEPAVGDPYIKVEIAAFHRVCQFLRDAPELQFDFLRSVSGVDWKDRLSCVYHLYSYTHNHLVSIRVDLETAKPRIASVMDLWMSADWHERETYDLMGIIFEGHTNLRRIFMADDWEGFPLRKDYLAPKEYHGISNEWTPQP